MADDDEVIVKEKKIGSAVSEFVAYKHLTI